MKVKAGKKYGGKFVCGPSFYILGEFDEYGKLKKYVESIFADIWILPYIGFQPQHPFESKVRYKIVWFER